MSIKQKAIIRNWCLVGNTLWGNVYGHPKHPDGEFVHTSQIVEINAFTNRAETRNTVYALQNRLLVIPAKKKKGFAAMTQEQRSRIASLGGKAAHAAGTAHKYTSEEARAAGAIGGRSRRKV